MDKIILTGYMGSGKTTVGKALADELSLPFFDLDNLIEQKTGWSVSEIFEKNGEIWFRKKEHEILHKFIEEHNKFVLSLGGGTPCYANNHLILQKEDISSFYLKAGIAAITERLSTEIEKRPLLKQINIDLSSYIRPHLFERTVFYKAAKYTIDTNNKLVENIVYEIKNKLST